jgi:hypothetical protein
MILWHPSWPGSTAPTESWTPIGSFMVCECRKGGAGCGRRETGRPLPCGNSLLLRIDFWTVLIRWSGTMSHRMWGFPEIPENLKWIVMGVLAIGLAIYLVRNLSR